MSHGISKTNGRDEMFYFGERPWHGLGVEVNAPATASEAIEAAHLDWSVALQPIYLQGGQTVPIAGYRANVRKDTGNVLGIVSAHYTPIQNREAFTFFDHVVGQGQAVYHTAGALGIGERIWMLAQLPNPVEVVKGDTVERYLLLTNSHDGGSALRMFFTPIRVVCQNTLNMAMAGEGGRGGISIRHIGEIKHKVTEAQRALGLAIRYYDTFTTITKALADVNLTEAKAKAYFARVIPSPKDGDEQVATRTKHTRENLLGLFESGKGNAMAGVRGTAWAALNAVVEYVDYGRKPHARDAQRAQSLRLESVWFGSGARLKARAWDEALALVPKKA